jgi:hypothetical protein
MYYCMMHHRSPKEEVSSFLVVEVQYGRAPVRKMKHPDFACTGKIHLVNAIQVY